MRGRPPGDLSLSSSPTLIYPVSLQVRHYVTGMEGCQRDDGSASKQLQESFQTLILPQVVFGHLFQKPCRFGLTQAPSASGPVPVGPGVFFVVVNPVLRHLDQPAPVRELSPGGRRRWSLMDVRMRMAHIAMKVVMLVMGMVLVLRRMVLISVHMVVIMVMVAMGMIVLMLLRIVPMVMSVVVIVVMLVMLAHNCLLHGC